MSWLETNWLRVILALTSTSTTAIALRFYTVWRKGKSDDAKLEQDGDAKIRDHYAAELAALREQIIKSGEQHAQRATQAAERYEAMLRAADERHAAAMIAADEREAACHGEVRQLREEVRVMADEIIGLRRQLGQAAKSAIVLATHAPGVGLVEAADRAADALDALENHTEVQS